MKGEILLMVSSLPTLIQEALEIFQNTKVSSRMNTDIAEHSRNHRVSLMHLILLKLDR